MNSSLAELVDDWHDFDLLIGTAAATLVGLMFVAASIGASIFTEKNHAAMEAFISPTVVHFTTVLVIAVLAVVPTHEWVTLAGLLRSSGLPARFIPQSYGFSSSSSAASRWTSSIGCSTRRSRCWAICFS